MTAPARSRFTGKVALVTGGGTGIGRATALAFAREGASVVVAGRSPQPLDETVELITHVGGQARAVPADITSSEEVARLVDSTVEAFGGLHIAFNNAGVFPDYAPLAELSEHVWNNVLDTNLTGTWLSMKHQIRHMRAHGGGAIVNMASAVGPHVTVPGAALYGATKSAITALSRSAAREYAADRIRVNAVSPASVNTPMSLLPGETAAERDIRLKERFPVGRVGKVEEVAAAVLWLASDEAGFTLGHDLVLDGGVSA
ncbi:glucose 1-dehydrogenase [Streptomyces sp. NPDC090442]|uniref:glucose 1-dehydrogenase n=1 Tax=Streptomyces sp. NPDC090442 TaxID=3365962 RepID=UPI0038291C36